MAANTIRKRIIRNLQYLSSRKFAPTQEVLDIISFTEDELERLQEEDAFPLEELVKISEYSGVSLDEIFKRELQDLDEKKEAALLRHLKPEEEDEDFEVVEIPLVRIAAASEYIGNDDWRSQQFLRLPKRLFPSFQVHNYTSFEIEGDSMAPDVPAGSIVIGEQVGDIEDFKDGNCYIVVSSSKIYFKRLYRSPHFKKDHTIRMVSDNEEAGHPEFAIEMGEIREFWRPYQIVVRASEI